MITARPTQFHRRFFTAYFRRRARKMFDRVAFRGHDVLDAWNADAAPAGPLVVVANHSSWWDAVMPILTSLDRFDHDAYGIMEERQLKRYGFFRRVGMFSIDRDSPRSAMRSLEYAADLLRGTGRVLWLFPQGDIRPNDLRPIRCYSGTSHLIRLLGDCTLIPVAFRYEMLGEERPVALGRFGRPERITAENIPDIRSLTASIEERITEEADLLREDVLHGRLERYRTILAGRGSIDKRWDRARGIETPER